jgi:membrane-bound lytic murein transglycosylase D
MNKLLTVVILLFTAFSVCSQKTNVLLRPGDTLNKDPFINTVEQSLGLFLKEYAGKRNYDSIIKALQYAPEDKPTFTDEVYCERLERINEMSPFHLDCNGITLSTIRFFVESRRSFVRIVLGRSKLYFDLFEEKLAEYGLPVELKYLSVIESGLRPQVKSKAGALGLWQFMYSTGLHYGLKENSYIDERMDPEKATDAACRFLRQLYGIYGDWNLALAAYNAGPGNVNKAIRRSGNKTTYWEIRPFLPAETQGYVPNFIAAAYLMTYHAEHNIVPVEAPIHYAQLDTMCLNTGIHMNTISRLVNWELEDIKTLNPIYKTTYIPKTLPPQCINGPLEKIGLLVSLEDSLVALEKRMFPSAPTGVTPQPVTPTPIATVDSSNLAANDSLPDVVKTDSCIYHKVKSGETMGNIATKYATTVDKIMEWNDLRTANIYVGQRLVLLNVKPKPVVKPVTPVKPVSKTTKKYYTVRSGETFSQIARKHGLSQTQLSRLNPGININRISVGQRIRVK